MRPLLAAALRPTSATFGRGSWCPVGHLQCRFHERIDCSALVPEMREGVRRHGVLRTPGRGGEPGERLAVPRMRRRGWAARRRAARHRAPVAQFRFGYELGNSPPERSVAHLFAMPVGSDPPLTYWTPVLGSKLSITNAIARDG
jgi:hypothetical protein